MWFHHINKYMIIIKDKSPPFPAFKVTYITMTEQAALDVAYFQYVIIRNETLESGMVMEVEILEVSNI